ncbi:kinase-like domain-containing protein [Mycena olivaceomarginata]|nr:kinase-like domain-containing protein [Mycena olivaceomarginata]
MPNMRWLIKTGMAVTAPTRPSPPHLASVTFSRPSTRVSDEDHMTSLLVRSPSSTPCAGQSDPSIERRSPRHRCNFRTFILCILRKRGNHTERPVTSEINPISDIDPANTVHTRTPSSTPARENTDGLSSWVPKLTTVAPDNVNLPGVEICFGDLSLSDNDPLPQSMKWLDMFPLFSGRCSDIYRANLTRSDGRSILVAIKLLRIADSAEAGTCMELLNREARMWRNLKHPNILPFLGVYEIGAPLPILLSPFFTFGHIGIYLRNHASASRQQLMHGVGNGLGYLHSNGIVHGDLKESNILVDKHHVACICDFGISRIMKLAGFTMYNADSTRNVAPELFAVLDTDRESTKVIRLPL